MKQISFIFIIFILFSCQSNPLKIDVSKIKMSKTIDRFERDLFALKEQKELNSENLQKQYGQFLRMYGAKVIQIGDMKSTDFDKYLSKFVHDTLMYNVYQKCETLFPELDDHNFEITQAFKHFAYYFPKRIIPKCYSMISGFNQSVVVDVDFIGVSLDKYMGADCDYYKKLEIPLYARFAMQEKNISTDIMLAFILSEFDLVSSTNHLLANMIYQGKIMYFLKACMPNKDDYLLFKYKAEQEKWCKANEAMMWTHVIDKKDLFTRSSRTISKYITNAPFTKGMPQESPGRTGIWIGYQIVKKYMNENENISIQNLMNDNNYEDILRKSKYNPSL